MLQPVLLLGLEAGYGSGLNTIPAAARVAPPGFFLNGGKSFEAE